MPSDPSTGTLWIHNAGPLTSACLLELMQNDSDGCEVSVGNFTVVGRLSKHGLPWRMLAWSNGSADLKRYCADRATLQM